MAILKQENSIAEFFIVTVSCNITKIIIIAETVAKYQIVIHIFTFIFQSKQYLH